MTEAPKLLPCPFCGTTEGLYPGYHGMGEGKPYQIDCCGCGIDFTPREGMDVIAAWNRRSTLHGQQSEAVAEPRAWQYELANYINPDHSYTGWDRRPRLSFERPEVPEGSIRNLVPLYTHPLPTEAAPVAVKALDESKTQGWKDDKGRFCLPMSDGYYIKFPPSDDRAGLYAVWFFTQPLGGHSEIAGAWKLAQAHHSARIRSAIIPAAKLAGAVEATDQQIKDATTEYLSHRGERPYRVLRGGQELWEAHAPAMRAAFRAAALSGIATDGEAGS